MKGSRACEMALVSIVWTLLILTPRADSAMSCALLARSARPSGARACSDAHTWKPAGWKQSDRDRLFLRGGGKVRWEMDAPTSSQGQEGDQQHPSHGIEPRAVSHGVVSSSRKRTPSTEKSASGESGMKEARNETDQGKEQKLNKPKGWLHCRGINPPVHGSRILSMKTPLDAAFFRRDDDQGDWHTPAAVREWRHANGGRIGLVVDLSFTSKYYNGTAEFADKGVEHAKIPVDGLSLEPKDALVNKFLAVLEDFWKRNPDSFVAVHCTHGLNRSGYMVVSYLVKVMKMSVREALRAFAEASPPGVWDRRYILTLYDKHNETRPHKRELPPPPPWKSQTQIRKKEEQRERRRACATRSTGTVVIMRGLPGSGKTTFVASQFRQAAVCSADSYFESGRTGRYNFDLGAIGAAHQMCMTKFLHAIERKEQLIIVDNTHSRFWEYRNYVHVATLLGYAVRVVEMECRHHDQAYLFQRRNVHSVPWSVVRRMYHSWEEDHQAEKIAPFVAAAVINDTTNKTMPAAPWTGVVRSSNMNKSADIYCPAGRETRLHGRGRGREQHRAMSRRTSLDVGQKGAKREDVVGARHSSLDRETIATRGPRLPSQQRLPIGSNHRIPTRAHGHNHLSGNTGSIPQSPYPVDRLVGSVHHSCT